MIKSIIFVVAVFLATVGAMENDVEMYSDEIPHMKLIWHGKESPYKILEKCGFKECHPFIYNGETYMDSNKIYAKQNTKKELEQTIFIKQQKRISSEIDFPSVHFYINEAVFKKSKWDVPRLASFYEGTQGDASTLSWRYIDYVLHERSGEENESEVLYTCPITEKIFKAIKKNGLENTVTRILLHNFNGNSYIYAENDTALNTIFSYP
jgi:hypothetical protein